MSVYLTNTTDLTSVANAIRTKGGTSAVLVYPSEFISAIQAIQTVGTYQSKVVSPTESQQIVNPDSGYDALSSVTINAISSTYIGTGIAQKSASDLVASGSKVTVPSGYYAAAASKAVTAGSITISSPTITANPAITLNSSTGVVTATVNNNTPIGATLVSGYISTYTGGTAQASGSKTLQLTTKSASTYTPGSATQTIASGQYLTGVQTIMGDSNLVAANIASGITIFGIEGTHQGGTEVDDIIIIGDYGLCFNNFSMSSNTCISEAGTVSGNTLIAV